MDLSELEKYVNEILTMAADMDSEIVRIREKHIDEATNDFDACKKLMAIAIQTQIDQFRAKKSLEFFIPPPANGYEFTRQIFEDCVLPSITKQVDQNLVIYDFLKHFLKENDK